MGTSNVSASSQDGLPPGSLTTFSVSEGGEIVGVFSNGLNRTLGQIALAKFLNPGGLLKMGQSLYAPSANSGLAQVGLPGQDGRGQVAAGYLEMSNVERRQGVHEHDHCPARLPGQQPGYYYVGRDATGSRQPEALGE